jgi:hypothetical protein
MRDLEILGFMGAEWSTLHAALPQMRGGTC